MSTTTNKEEVERNGKERKPVKLGFVFSHFALQTWLLFHGQMKFGQIVERPSILGLSAGRKIRKNEKNAK